MAVQIDAKIDNGWGTTNLEFICFRAATQKGSAVAASVAPVAGRNVASASINMASFGAGDIEVVLQQNASPYGLIWSTNIEIDASGDLIDTDITSLAADIAAIKAKTDLIGTGDAFINAPVPTNGYLQYLVRGDHYDNGRALVWTLDPITGITPTGCKFGMINKDNDSVQLIKTGTFTDNVTSWELSFDLAPTDTNNLALGFYDWSVSLTTASEEYTVVKNLYARFAVELQQRQTTAVA